MICLAINQNAKPNAFLPRLLAGIAHERDLPVVCDTVPLPGQPLVLYSGAQRALYLVGQCDDDLAAAVDQLLAIF